MVSSCCSANVFLIHAETDYYICSMCEYHCELRMYRQSLVSNGGAELVI